MANKTGNINSAYDNFGDNEMVRNATKSLSVGCR